MKDLDFDELDKAVNLLVSSQPKNSGDRPKKVNINLNEQASSEISATPKHSLVSTSAKAATPASSVVVTARRPTPRLGVKKALTMPSRGSFIDVMAPKPQQNVSKKPVNRQAPAIKPLENTILEESAIPEINPTTAKESKNISTTSTSLPAAESTAGDTWPDPLDFHADESSAVNTKEQAPATPFLPDRKVEKRPLGAFSHVTMPVKPTRTVADPLETNEQPASSQVTPQPEEQSITEHIHETETTSQTSGSEVQETAQDAASSAPETTETAAKQLRESALLSIPQQYKREEKESSEAPRPVFDTREYHQPLLEATTHGHRSKTWLIILTIIIILLAAGYAIFTWFVQNN